MPIETGPINRNQVPPDGGGNKVQPTPSVEKKPKSDKEERRQERKEKSGEKKRDEEKEGTSTKRNETDPEGHKGTNLDVTG